MEKSVKKTYTKDLFRQFLPLLTAIALQQLLSLLVNLLDNFMLGRYLESAMSAATVANQIQGILQNLIFGVGAGITVLGSQYWGKRQTEPIKRIIACGLKIAVAVGLVFTVLMYLFPRQIIGLLTNDQEILEQAMEYMSVMCWSFIIYSISMILMMSLQAVETAFIGTIMSASTIVINFCLNSILIYGRFGAPELGIKGAAIATFTSRCIELVIVLTYVLFADKKLQLKIKDLVRIKTGFFKDYILAAWPTMVSGAMWGLGLAAQTAILGHMSSEAIGASSIAVTVAQIFLVISYSSSTASGVVMGKIVGNNRNECIKPYTKRLQLFYICAGITAGFILFLLRNLIVGFYDVSEETSYLAVRFIIVMSIVMPGSVYEYPVMSGIIAGGGNTMYQAIIDNLFIWCFTIPVSALSAFVFEWPPLATFFLLKVDQLIKCIPNAIYCNSYKWIKNRTRN